MTAQLSIDFEPLARNTDPVTSHMAARDAKELAARHHRIVLACLEQHGPSGKDRIAALTSLSGVAVCRRLSELEKAGNARPTGKHVQSAAGRSEREWERI